MSADSGRGLVSSPDEGENLIMNSPKAAADFAGLGTSPTTAGGTTALAFAGIDYPGGVTS